MEEETKEVKDIVTENAVVEKFSEFIGKDSFSSLASCATIVAVITQFAKMVTTIEPILLSFIFSIVVSGLKLVLSGDYSKNNIILAIINVFPMALTASGGYDVFKRISIQ